MQTRYDFIIIGAGPNGLQTGAYLSKAGHRKCSFWSSVMSAAADSGPKNRPIRVFCTAPMPST